MSESPFRTARDGGSRRRGPSFLSSLFVGGTLARVAAAVKGPGLGRGGRATRRRWPRIGVSQFRRQGASSRRGVQPRRAGVMPRGMGRRAPFTARNSGPAEGLPAVRNCEPSYHLCRGVARTHGGATHGRGRARAGRCWGRAAAWGRGTAAGGERPRQAGGGRGSPVFGLDVSAAQVRRLGLPVSVGNGTFAVMLRASPFPIQTDELDLE